MIYCINPLCDARENPDSQTKCLSCGTPLVINSRIRLLKPLRELNKDPFSYTEIFEVEDAGTKWDPGPKQRILKVLKWSEPKLVELFERESKTLRLLQHESIPKSTIDDFFTFTPITPPGTSVTLRCLVMDKFEGLDLHEYLKANGKLSQELAVDWLKQLVDILHQVHRSEFFHRDIKPSNIICQPNGKLALIDFGGSRRLTNTYMAKVSASGGTSTSTSKYEITVVASSGYSPLEQINGKAVPQSDFYALGRTFVYLLTGIPLNQLPTDKKSGKIVWRNKAPQVDKIFADLIDDLIANFPGERPQTTEVILQRLKRLPLQSKINRIVKSKTFKISAAILGVLAVFGAYKVSKPIAANYFFTKASRNAQNPKVAKKYYELAIKYNPDDVDAYNNLAFTCKQLRDFKCVTNNYQSALKSKPNYWPIYYGLGSFYDENKEYDKAAQQYQLAIQKSNNVAVPPINNLSRIKNINGEHNKAQFLALEGLQKTSDKHLQAALHKNLGWAFLKQKIYEKSFFHLQNSLELDPQRADSYCLLAQAQEKLNLIDEAKLSWEACLVLDSNLPEVQGWRQQILQRIL